MHPLIVDCNNLSYIARFALKEAELSHGEFDTEVMWGFLRQVLKAARYLETKRVLFAWDSNQSHRKQLFPEYKGQRHQDMTEDDIERHRSMGKQMAYLRTKLLPEMGFRNVFMQVGYEADDIIAHIVNNWSEDSHPVVASADQDLYQLLDRCTIYNPRTKDLIDSEAFKRMYNIAPDKWPDVKALAGDSSDNVPGVWKVGEKTAIKYLQGGLAPTSKAYHRIVEDEAQKIVERNKKLMALPYPGMEPVVVHPQEHLRLDAFVAVCRRFNFRSFLSDKGLEEWAMTFEMDNEERGR